ncbi:hypothetical protein [Desulfovibrio sp. TomC]|uniref:hypothetical protein n=1 Tax=Desulfovibrio sp. TomC TaxID=1562888 RepID=UPI0005743E12|nr:hypothetical protein [Desulfovibrio sp. TomC]KHK00565.1 hypothetical protein NY78_4033 [Desulfovibrio sp. TomC]
MLRMVPFVLVVLLLAGCAGKGTASRPELAGTPTVYADVLSKPNPLLVGCFMRSRPSEFNRPNSYHYCLVEQGGKYAVYYNWRDGKSGEEHKGWMPFTVDGDKLISGTDPSSFVVKNGSVWHSYGGRETLHRMLPE